MSDTVQMRCCGRHVDASAVVERLVTVMRSAFLSGAHEGEHCQSCGRAYDDVYWLPDSWWAAITPKPEHPEGGLLCPDCALERLTTYGSHEGGAS